MMMMVCVQRATAILPAHWTCSVTWSQVLVAADPTLTARTATNARKTNTILKLDV